MMKEIMGIVSDMLINAEFTSERGIRVAFRWGASFSSLFLLVLNLIKRRSGLQATLLVFSLVTSLPEVIFQILRGQFGCWVASLAIAASYCFPCIVPVSRFLLFIVTPDWLAYELRESIAGGVLCLVICILLAITEIQALGGCGNCMCDLHCLGFWSSIILLFFFTVLYLCLGLW